MSKITQVVFESRKVDQWGNVFYVDVDRQELTPAAGFVLDCSTPMIQRVEYQVRDGELVIQTDTLMYLDAPHQGKPAMMELRP